MDYGRRLGFAAEALASLRGEGLHREMLPSRAEGSRVTVGGRSLVNLCSNDYLGLPPTTLPPGQMQSSSRLLAGNDEAYAVLEGGLASHKSHEAALVYPTGYMANLGAVSALASPGDLVLSDELNHASIIDACRLSGASVSVYAHNDMEDLRARARRGARNRFIVCEGVFSMDGDRPDLARISEIAREAGAVTVLDDAHGDFAVGPGGRGTPADLGAPVDVYVSSLSKALGSFGGYVASSSDVAGLLANRSRAFIYTSALPRQLVLHAAERLRADRSGRQEALARNAAALSRGLRQLGYEPGGSHIMPVHIGGEREAAEFARVLRERGAFAQAVRYPTVPRGRARIRVSATAWLSPGDVEEALAAFEAARARVSA